MTDTKSASGGDGGRSVLEQLIAKWNGEATNYDARTDDDYIVHAMMLRYCAVQLESALLAAVRAPEPPQQETGDDPATAELLTALDELYPLPDDHHRRVERAGRTAAAVKRWMVRALDSLGADVLSRLTAASAPSPAAAEPPQYCRKHGFIHGAEAEEIRARVEAILAHVDHEGDDAGNELDRALRIMLDEVDARDSVAFVEASSQVRSTPPPATDGGPLDDRRHPPDSGSDGAAATTTLRDYCVALARLLDVWLRACQWREFGRMCSVRTEARRGRGGATMERDASLAVGALSLSSEKRRAVSIFEEKAKLFK